MSEWTEYRLDEVYDFKSGLSKAREQFGFGYGFVSFKDVFYNYFIPDNLTELVNSNNREQESCSVKRGDVFLTRTSETFNELGMSSVALKDYDKATFNGFTKRLRPLENSEIVPEYAGYYFRSSYFRKLVTSMATMSTRASLNNEILSKLIIRYPSKPEQKAIAKILGDLDGKIELNRKMNQTLEEMAQALFKSWFVDFDPVLDNALAAGNEIPEELQILAKKRSLVAEDLKLLHTNPDLAQLFPDSFVFNEELGKWIPEGWEVKSIEKLCEKIQNGGTPRRDNSDFWENGDIPWLASGEVRQNIICNTNSFITEKGLNGSSAKLVKAFSTVIAMYGATAGQVAIISKQLSTNQAVCSLTPITGYEFFNYLNLSNQVSHLESQARGSAQQNISKGIIELLKIVVPNDEIVQEFQIVMKNNYTKLISNIHLIESLNRLRDTLLPQLISGKLRVPEAMLKIKDLIA
jgi:type I restriction enzyme, S subunit